MYRTKKFLATLSAAGLMSFGLAAPAMSTPVITGGLVNITVVDVLNNTNVNVQVPVGVAANVCGIQANVLAAGNVAQPVDCTSATTQDLPVVFR